MGQLLSRLAASWQTRGAARSATAGGGEELEEHEMQKFSSHTGAFFGTHFLMGGERYELNRPEAFLFGENCDLDLLGTKPVPFPYVRNPVTDPVRTLNALINIRRDSVKFVRHSSEDPETAPSENLYRIEFQFDCDSPCFVQIHFHAKEVVTENRVEIVSRNPELNSSDKFHFQTGAGQFFNKYVFDPSVHNIDSMRYEGGLNFPVVIEMRTVNHPCEQVQTTLASIERGVERSRNGVGLLVLKPLKQKLIADGVIYLLQEIFGIENKEVASTEADEENGAECIICMCDLRDTVILPCRHLCICNGCAETLKYKLNNCPICRSPFRALLQLKAMRAISTVSVTDQASAQSLSQTRYETLTLIEALNGPVSHVTTIGAGGKVRGSLRISPHTATTVARGGGGLATAECGQLSRSASSRRSNASRRREVLTVEEPETILCDEFNDGLVNVVFDKDDDGLPHVERPKTLAKSSSISDSESSAIVVGSARSSITSSNRRQFLPPAKSDSHDTATTSGPEHHDETEEDSGFQQTSTSLDDDDASSLDRSVATMRPPSYRPPPPPSL